MAHISIRSRPSSMPWRRRATRCNAGVRRRAGSATAPRPPAYSDTTEAAVSRSPPAPPLEPGQHVPGDQGPPALAAVKPLLIEFRVLSDDQPIGNATTTVDHHL